MDSLPVQADNQGYVDSWLSQVGQVSRDQSSCVAETATRRPQPWRPHNIPLVSETTPQATASHTKRPASASWDQSLRSFSPDSRDHRENVPCRLAEPHSMVHDVPDDFSMAEPLIPSVEENGYTKQARRKTRDDRYGTSNKRRRVTARKDKRHSETHKVSKRDRAKSKRPTKLRSSREVMDNFMSPSVLSTRVTMQPSLTTGLFGNARVSRRSFVTDLDFNDMSFLGDSVSLEELQRREKVQEKGDRRISKLLQEESEFFDHAVPSAFDDTKGHSNSLDLAQNHSSGLHGDRAWRQSNYSSKPDTASISKNSRPVISQSGRATTSSQGTPGIGVIVAEELPARIEQYECEREQGDYRSLEKFIPSHIMKELLETGIFNFDGRPMLFDSEYQSKQHGQPGRIKFNVNADQDNQPPTRTDIRSPSGRPQPVIESSLDKSQLATHRDRCKGIAALEPISNPPGDSQLHHADEHDAKLNLSQIYGSRTGRKSYPVDAMVAMPRDAHSHTAAPILNEPHEERVDQFKKAKCSPEELVGFGLNVFGSGMHATFNPYVPEYAPLMARVSHELPTEYGLETTETLESVQNDGHQYETFQHFMARMDSEILDQPATNVLANEDYEGIRVAGATSLEEDMLQSAHEDGWNAQDAAFVDDSRMPQSSAMDRPNQFLDPGQHDTELANFWRPQRLY